MGAVCMDLYLKTQRCLYRRGNRAVKKRILDEFCETHGYHRKAAARLLRQLPITDIFSGWTEMGAAWNKGATGIMEGIQDIEAHLPFEIKGFIVITAQNFSIGILFVVSRNGQKNNSRFNLPILVNQASLGEIQYVSEDA